MKERPILFSGPMVRAILEGRKTQTRRVVKPQEQLAMFQHGAHGVHPSFMPPFIMDGFLAVGVETMLKDNFAYLKKSPPYGVVGDHLWVKETTWYDVRKPQECVIYSATPEAHKYRLEGVVKPCDRGINTAYLEKHEYWKRRPSIFMRRWMSRIQLEITSVRVERLNDCSEADAEAEGCIPDDTSLNPNHIGPATSIYEALWESINGEGSWAANPWVWVIEFNRILPTL